LVKIINKLGQDKQNGSLDVVWMMSSGASKSMARSMSGVAWVGMRRVALAVCCFGGGDAVNTLWMCGTGTKDGCQLSECNQLGIANGVQRCGRGSLTDQPFGKRTPQFWPFSRHDFKQIYIILHI
jgi:hypothetical protein